MEENSWPLCRQQANILDEIIREYVAQFYMKRSYVYYFLKKKSKSNKKIVHRNNGMS